MSESHWTKTERLICPDCGYEFGTRTVAGSVNLTLDPGRLRAQCRRVTDPNSPDIHCPRFDEVKAEADRSERTSD